MKIAEFTKFVVDNVGNDIMDRHRFLNKFNKRIVVDNRKWYLFKPKYSNTLKDGVYLTVRVGLGGIYTMMNTWDSKSNDWTTKVADDSYTIMYRDLTEEDLDIDD